MIDVMVNAAKCTIPSVCSGSSKAYWNSELQQLKEDSVEAHLGSWDGKRLVNPDMDGWMKALKCLKNGKAAGYDGIVKEHLLYAHPSMIVHLMFLFNIMTLHCFVPDNFGVGVIVPIIKDRFGDISDVNNYRGITLSPVISKLFEYCLLDKYQAAMTTSDVQFGF